MSPRSFPAKTLLFCILLLAGCAGPMRTPPPDSDPANPRAREAPALPLSTALNPREKPLIDQPPEPSAVDENEPGHARNVEKKLFYTCPMHAEVVSNKPGNCPKCGMRLVLKRALPE